jgi:hypothetical protein
VDISEEGTEPDRRSSDTTVDGESEWGDGVAYFENITGTRDQYPVVYPDLNKEDPEVDYLLSTITEEIMEINRDQTNLYATQEREERLGWQEVRMVSCDWKPMTVEDIHYNTYINGYSHAARAATLLVQ